MPKVSIVLPNYNYAHYLDERIQSLLNQTYKDFELIILDCASVDNSIAVISKYTHDPRIKTKFYSHDNGLPYERWNDGADLAQGEYLIIANADDSCEPTLLEKLVEKLDAHSNVGLAFSESWIIDSNSKRIRKANWENGRWKTDFIDQGKNELKYLFLWCTVPNASCALMRREFFIKAGKFDATMFLSADWMLWSKMMMISDIAYVSEPLNHFRTHSNTVRQRAGRRGIDFEEDLLVKRYILEHSGLSFSTEEIHKSFDGIKWKWIETVLSSPTTIDLRRNIRIYKNLSSIYSDVGWQLGVRLLLQYTGFAKLMVSNLPK